MINNNTSIPQKPTPITGSSSMVSGISKVEFQKTISSLQAELNKKVSKEVLDEWLRSHPYISKDMVRNIASEMSLAPDYLQYINDIKGEIVEIKDKLNTIPKNIISKESIEEIYVTKTDVQKVKTEIQKEIQKQELPKGIATETWVKEQGYVKTVPDISGLASENWVKDQKYATQAKLNNTIKNYVTKDSAGQTYLSKSDAGKTYLTQKDAQNVYLSKEDYRGLKSAATISDTYKDKTWEDIEKMINEGTSFLDGFYIIKTTSEGDSVVLMKNNDPKYVYLGGGSFVTWVEEDD